MFQGLLESQVKGAVEAMLFVTDEPVGALTLAKMLDCDPALVEDALSTLRDELAGSDRGIQLREVAGGWRLFTHPAYHELIEQYVLSWDTRKLSAAAMETLAVVAYAQPVTRARCRVGARRELRQLHKLAGGEGSGARGGRGRHARQPVLYATTRAFLEKFGFAFDCGPAPLDDFAPDDETRRLITERLSATRDEAAITDEQARLMAEGLMYGDDAEDEAQGGLEGTSALGDRPTSPDDVRADVSSAANAQAADSRSVSPREAMFAEAIASTLGVVDKIDFDSLVFETEDE